MSDPAAPWWADVQHLRPREDRAAETTTPPARFTRTEDARLASVATLEHDLPNPWLDEPDAAWAETYGEPEVADEPAAPAPSALWDPSLEEAFARTPSWADEDDPRLLPKGADRIENGRRTIEIRGQVDRVAGITAPAETAAATRTGRRRTTRGPAERLAGRPDRIAMWAFLLGVLLILVAALSDPGSASAGFITF